VSPASKNAAVDGGSSAAHAVSPARRYVLFGVFAVVSIVFDQWTKALARSVLRPLGPYRPKVVVDGFFKLRYSENPGVAFGLLQQLPAGRMVLTLLALAAASIRSTRAPAMPCPEYPSRVLPLQD